MNVALPAASFQQPKAEDAPSLVLDFDSDEPLPVCPMRKDGLGEGEICESCQ